MTKDRFLPPARTAVVTVCVLKFSELCPGKPAAGSRPSAGRLVQNQAQASQKRSKSTLAGNVDSGYLRHKAGFP
jgi:hypothetical protein